MRNWRPEYSRLAAEERVHQTCILIDSGSNNVCAVAFQEQSCRGCIFFPHRVRYEWRVYDDQVKRTKEAAFNVRWMVVIIEVIPWAVLPRSIELIFWMRQGGKEGYYQFNVLTMKLTSKIAQCSCSSGGNEKNSDGVDRNATRLPSDIDKHSRIALHSLSMVFFEYQYWLRSRFSSVWLRKEFAGLSSLLKDGTSTRVLLLLFSLWQFLHDECLSDISLNSLKRASSLIASLLVVFMPSTSSVVFSNSNFLKWKWFFIFSLPLFKKECVEQRRVCCWDQSSFRQIE